MKLPEFTKEKIEKLVEKGRRIDRRDLLEFRKIKIISGVSKNAEGSAEVQIGDTIVQVGVKLDVGEPYTDKPDEGVLITTAEFSPIASEKFELGPPKVDAIELARVVDRGIRESGFIDFKKLCIKKGKLVWIIFLDIYPINDGGNLIDASALASIIALKEAVFPKLQEDKVLYGKLTKEKLPLTNLVPITITFYKLGNKIILDPTTEEEEIIKFRLTIALSEENNKIYINALQKGGDEPMSEEELDYILRESIQKSRKLRKFIK